MASNEEKELALDQLATGRLNRRKFLAIVGGALFPDLCEGYDLPCNFP